MRQWVDGCELPIRWDKAVGHVGVGAVVKRLSDDLKAVVIDFVGSRPTPIIARVKDRYLLDDARATPSGPKAYTIDKVADESEWIVLTLGGDELIYE